MLEYARHSIVDKITANSISQCGQLQIGDSRSINNRSYILANQKLQPNFLSYCYSFNDFEIFFRGYPEKPYEHEVVMNQFNQCPLIKVGEIHLQGIALSSLVHIGSTEMIWADSRTNYIRDFNLGFIQEKADPEKPSNEYSSNDGKQLKAVLKNIF